ncbi:hypothetical protein Tco_0577917, partial [Tanacetum coccineum]
DEDDLDRVVPDLRKRDREEDEDTFAGSNQGKRKRSSGKDSEPSKTSSPSKETSKGDTLPNTSKTGKSTSAEESVKEVTHEPWFNNLLSAQKDPPTIDELMATPIDFSNFVKNLDKITKADLENPEGDRCPFDLSKRLPLKGHPGHLIVAAEYFFNNDLEYFKSTDSERKYTASITKTKAARYELVDIEVMIPEQWSTTKVGYDKDVAFGIKHWDPNANNSTELNSTVSQNMIIADRQLYKFKEGDFMNLHLNDIKDMLLLAVQHKLFHLAGEVIVDLTVGPRMFTRSLIIKKRVKDVQLGVKSYQKKLNITKPQKDFPGIFAKELYTPSFEPPKVIYEDLSH